MGMSIEEMKNVGVRTVDRDSLVDINEIVIDDRSISGNTYKLFAEI